MSRSMHKMDRRSFEAVTDVLSSIHTPEEMRAFLGELLTPGEMRDIALRWKLLELLAEGVPQRKIAEPQERRQWYRPGPGSAVRPQSWRQDMGGQRSRQGDDVYFYFTNS